MSKSIFESKTFWLNVISIALAIITITDPALIGIKPETLLWLSGILNILLRFISSGSVSLTGSKSG